MNFTQAQIRLSCWLTMLVMLFASFAPSLSMAMAARAGEFEYLGQICSANKMQTRDQDQALNATKKVAHDGQQHCPFCLPHGGDLHYLPELRQPDFAINLPPHLPSLFYQSRFLTHTWSPAVARAPPLL